MRPKGAKIQMQKIHLTQHFWEILGHIHLQSLLTKMMIRIEWCFLNSALFECWSTRNDDSHKMMQTCSEKKKNEIWISEIIKIQISKNTSVGLFERAAKAVCFPMLKGANQYQNAEPNKETFFEQIWSGVERAVLCKTEFVFEM